MTWHNCFIINVIDFLIVCILSCEFSMYLFLAPLSLELILANGDIVGRERLENNLVANFDSFQDLNILVNNFQLLPQDEKQEVLTILLNKVKLVGIVKKNSLRLYLWCLTLDALMVIRQLVDSGELKPILELLLNRLLTDNYQFGPVHLQHVYLIDYCKCEQYFLNHLSGKSSNTGKA